MYIWSSLVAERAAAVVYSRRVPGQLQLAAPPPTHFSIGIHCQYIFHIVVVTLCSPRRSMIMMNHGYNSFDVHAPPLKMGLYVSGHPLRTVYCMICTSVRQFMPL